MTRRTFCTVPLAAAAQPAVSPPWYSRILRWGQTNLTEIDAERYDAGFWRAHWRRTRVQGVIVNAAGIVAYYPSAFPLQFRSPYLKTRDLFGEIVQAARGMGLAVLARMDSNRATEDFYKAHPDWFALDASGEPYRAADRYVTCIHGPYYDEFLPGILREIANRFRPDGFTDNSWAGLGRESICYCANCRRKFRAATGLELPTRRGWNTREFRQWILWNYARRTELWDANNRITREAGGPDCAWVGMNTASVTGSARSFRDLRELAQRAPMLLLDHQRREDAWGFTENCDAGARIHGVMGWDKLAPESMAMYQAGPDSFRLAAKPAPEARQWMLAGFAGGIQPWWHHIGSVHEDRRAYATAEPVMRWHEQNQQYLVDRRPVAPVLVGWSQRNTDFYGREQPELLVDQPYRGLVQALVRARLLHRPVHLADVTPGSGQVLVLPNVAAMSVEECAGVRRFVEAGGSLLATGYTSLYDEWGDARSDYGLADLFGAHRAGAAPVDPPNQHTYLRIAEGERAEYLRAFADTDILAFGGVLEPLEVAAGAQVPLTFVPNFPVYPPEFSYMRTPRTEIPGLVVNEQRNGARVAFLPADLDRRYARSHLPDHADLLAALVRWCLRGQLSLEVMGAGLLDCRLYQQPGRLILHLVNLSGHAAWRQPMDELLPVGPIQVRVSGLATNGDAVRLLVSGQNAVPFRGGGGLSFTISRILDHEVAVIGT